MRRAVHVCVTQCCETFVVLCVCMPGVVWHVSSFSVFCIVHVAVFLCEQSLCM